jgi:hypothetical protein
VELAIDQMTFKRRRAYKKRMHERKESVVVAEYAKPKREICKPEKWNPGKSY